MAASRTEKFRYFCTFFLIFFQSNNELYNSIKQDDELEKHIYTFWNLLLIISNFFNILANSSIFVHELGAKLKVDEVETLVDITTGFGAFFSWLNILDVLTHFKSMIIVRQTFMNSAPSLFLFVIGACPIYFGYLFLGMCLFQEVERFENLRFSIISLNALLTGQSLQSNFMDTYKIFGYWGFTYTLTWLLFICYGAMNVFKFLLDSGYQYQLRAIEKKKKNKKSKEKFLILFQSKKREIGHEEEFIQ